MRDHVETRETFVVQIFSFSLTACDASFKLKSIKHTKMSHTYVALQHWWRKDNEQCWILGSHSGGYEEL
jgi:predicted RNase H-like nuclease